MTDKKQEQQCRLEGCFSPMFNPINGCCQYHSALFNKPEAKEPATTITGHRYLPQGFPLGEKIKWYYDKAHEDNDGCLINHLGCHASEIQLIINGQRVQLADLIMEARGEPRPRGKELCHRCGEGTCINPDDWYWGTSSQNKEDRYVHELLGWLTTYQVERVIELYYADSVSLSELSERFFVPVDIIKRAINLRTPAHMHTTKERLTKESIQ